VQSVFKVLKSERLRYVMQQHIAVVHKLWCATGIVHIYYYLIQISGNMLFAVGHVEQAVP
jgi:hypothetical protein